jgi:Fe2+ transport system protein B
MMDVVRKRGDSINVEELSKRLGCKVVEISALKEDGIFEAAELAIEAARKGRENKLPFSVKYLSGTGHLLPRTMILSHASGKISLGEMCKILNVKSSHIGRIEQAVMYK